LPAIGVQPRTGGIDKELTWLETPSVEVPNLIGMTKKDLQTQQVDLEIEVQGEGEKVVEQQPRAGVKVKAGTKIRLYLGS
jgi:stage V sporulation protein D (sporulation-specific penicillin-binding protein)